MSGNKRPFENVYFVNGTAYAGKSTLVKNLAARFGGVCCGENYHDVRLPGLDPGEYPALCWSRDLTDWRLFIRRSPEEYERWTDAVTLECARLELEILETLRGCGKPVFVDTNLPAGWLREWALPGHVLILLAPPEASVRRFFERPDREKQFLYRLLLEEPDPQAAMDNFRAGLSRINSPARYAAWEHSGFPVLRREEGRTEEETLALAAGMFTLTGGGSPC